MKTLDTLKTNIESYEKQASKTQKANNTPEKSMQKTTSLNDQMPSESVILDTVFHGIQKIYDTIKFHGAIKTESCLISKLYPR